MIEKKISVYRSKDQFKVRVLLFMTVNLFALSRRPKDEYISI